MAGLEYINSNLEVDGTLMVETVPNAVGVFVTYDSTTKLFGVRTAQQTVSDLGLSTVVSNSHSHANMAVLNGITSTLVSNWNTAFGWGNFRDFGLGADAMTVTNLGSMDLKGRFFRYDNTATTSGTTAVGKSQAAINLPFHASQAYAFAMSGTGADAYSNTTSSYTHLFKFWTTLDFTQTNVDNWNTAYGWGNHSGLYALVGRTITAGNGLSGGGSLAANRTITLGTPGAITLSSTNSVTSTSHTHALDAATTTAINNGNTAFGWGDHASVGYALASQLSSYVPTSRTITINGVTQSLSANRTWTIPVVDTITRLRGTASGTYTSGDLTLLAGANTTITQSGSNITIASTNTNTTYTSSNGILLTGTNFTPVYGTAANTIAQGNDSRFHNPVTLGTSNGLTLTNQLLSLQIATQTTSGALYFTDKVKLDSITDVRMSNWDAAYGWGNHSGLYALVGRSIVAGNGLSGGGTLAANRTITLGTPGDITLSSTNSVTSTSHTHALDAATTTAINNGQTAYGWGRGLRVDGNGVPMHNNQASSVDTFSIRNASAWMVGSANRPFGLNASVVNFTSYNSAGTYGFTLGARNNRMGFVTEENSVFGNWLEFIHDGNLDTQATSLGFIKSSALPTVNNGQLTLSTGTGLSGSANFTANQSGNSSFSVGIASTHKLPTVTEWNALSTQTLGNSTSNLIVSNTVQRAALTGDVTAAQNSNATTIANSAVTHAKYQNIATQRILGRGATGTGNVQELTLGANLSLSTAGVLSATNTNTTYSAGTGLTLSGTTFGQAITTSGSGTYVQSITQTASGFQVNLGTPPNTNTTYSAGTLAILQAGTNTTNRVWGAKILNDWADGKYSWVSLTGDNHSIRSADTRSVNGIVNTAYKSGAYFEFKTRSVIGFPGSSSYAALMTFAPYSDHSGNAQSAYQLGHSNGILAFRNIASQTTFNSWKILADRDWVLDTVDSIFYRSPQNGIATKNWNSFATGNYSTAIGNNTIATSKWSTVIGASVSTVGLGSTVIGNNSTNNGGYSMVIGQYNANNAPKSSLLGLGLVNVQDGYTAIGQYNRPNTQHDFGNWDKREIFAVGSGTDSVYRRNLITGYANNSLEHHGRAYYDPSTRQASWFTINNTLADVQWVKEWVAANSGGGGGGNLFYLRANTNAYLSGNVTLKAGTNITLSQSGNNITINSAGGGGGGSAGNILNTAPSNASGAFNGIYDGDDFHASQQMEKNTGQVYVAVYGTEGYWTDCDNSRDFFGEWGVWHVDKYITQGTVILSGNKIPDMLEGEMNYLVVVQRKRQDGSAECMFVNYDALQELKTTCQIDRMIDLVVIGKLSLDPMGGNPRLKVHQHQF